MWLDFETLQAISLYVRTGRRPGHFVRALLKGDMDDAWETAYDDFKRPGTMGPGNMVERFMSFVSEQVPEEARGSAENIDRWMEHRGLEEAPDAVKMMIKLRHTKPFWE